MSESRTDLQPVMRAIAERAARLCEASDASVSLVEAGRLRLAAGFGNVTGSSATDGWPVGRGYVTGRAVTERRAVHVRDVLARAGEYPQTQAISRRLGVRTVLAVPLLRKKRVLGVISLHRLEVRPFKAQQIALLRTFADQAAIAIENVRLFTEARAALERQTATAEILRVISRSPTDIKPVLHALAQSAARLCEATDVVIRRVEADTLRAVVHVGSIALPPAAEALPLGGRGITRDAVRECRTIHVPDVTAPEVRKQYPQGVFLARPSGPEYRTVLSVPMVRDRRAVGVIVIRRAEARPFSDQQIKLLETFADQAVIAIENTRLFNDTKQALEQQIATGEILRVISASPTDVVPVFEAILRSAVQLCEAQIAAVFRFDGRLVHMAATHNWSQEAIEYFSSIYPSPPNPALITGRVIMTKAIVGIADAAADPHYDPNSAASGHWRRMLGLPMMRGDKVLGVLVVTWREPGETPQRQVDLLQTFANQAAIAIENVRLFNETMEALEQQTAISDILGVISRSPADLQPVFDSILTHALKLCEGDAAVLWRFDGSRLRLAAGKNTSAPGHAYLLEHPLDLGTYNPTPRAALERRIVHEPDVFANPQYRPLVPPGAAPGSQSSSTQLAVPLLKEGVVLGVITVWRFEKRAFADKQLALLKTFADQAVIAIENVRLFNETKEALDQQMASAQVLEAISSSIADTQPVFEKILTSCERLFQGLLVGVTQVQGGRVHLVDYRGPDSDRLKTVYPLPLTRESGTGAAILDAQVAQFPDIEAPGVPTHVAEGCRTFGARSIVFAPMIFDGRGIGAIWVARRHTGPFGEKQLALLRTFADQAVIAIQNARLFREIQEKSAQLEVANRHKSEFLANMSHELRTPLNAVIGFSEVLMDRMFGELNDKQAEYLKDIHESGRHLLSLINDILDLSKIEAGRMELELSSFHLPSAIANAMTLIRERAQRHGIRLDAEIEERLGEFNGDERKFKQIMLNLLSNAVKFTPDGGRVDVRARLNTSGVEIAVRDTGVGIAPQDQAALFEEFSQVGRDAARKAEGTGLGLALTKKFVELHGGGIRVDSAPGKGSTFTVVLPVRA